MHLAKLVEGLLLEHGELDPRVLMSKKRADAAIEALFTTATSGPKRVAKTVLIREGKSPDVRLGFQAEWPDDPQ